MKFPKFSKWIGVFLVLSQAVALSGAAKAGDMVSPTQVSIEMFKWWNEAFVNDGFYEEAFAEHFTDDVEFHINDRPVVAGIPAVTAHFRKIQQSKDLVQIVLPYEESFEAGDKVFTYHIIRSISEGNENRALAMGYIQVRDGKVSLVRILQRPIEQASADE